MSYQPIPPSLFLLPSFPPSLTPSLPPTFLPSHPPCRPPCLPRCADTRVCACVLARACIACDDLRMSCLLLAPACAPHSSDHCVEVERCIPNASHPSGFRSSILTSQPVPPGDLHTQTSYFTFPLLGLALAHLAFDLSKWSKRPSSGPQHAEACAQPSAGSASILCYGDSLTAGYFSNGAEFHPYAGTLQRTLGRAALVEHCGLSGWTAKREYLALRQVCCSHVRCQPAFCLGAITTIWATHILVYARPLLCRASEQGLDSPVCAPVRCCRNGKGDAPPSLH